jgi:DNA replication protein DnaC
MNEDTLNKMRQMKFYGMARAFSTSLETEKNTAMTADEMISFLIDTEWDDRNNRKIERQVKNAKFRYNANIEQLRFDLDRKMDKNQIQRFASCDFVKKKESILITGSTGVGKSYIASAIGNQACMLGYRVLYMASGKLFAKLKMAKADGSYLREVAKIENQELLIIDDFGIQPLDAHSRAALMEVMEDRHGKRSTIITSQVPVAQWYEVIGEKTIADAILDRLVHDAHRVNIEGESLRKKFADKNKSKENGGD